MIQTVAVFFSLVASGFSLSCITCVSHSEVGCTGVGTTCDSSDICVSHNYMIGQTRVFNRACGKSLFCGLAWNVPWLQFKMATSCCDADNCEPLPPSFSPPQGVKNGLLCPGCLGTTAEHCVSSGVQECTGNERKCGTIGVSARSGPFLYFHGCVVDPICNFGNNSVNVFEEDFIFRITCEDPERPSINTSFGTPTTQTDKPGTQPTQPESQTRTIETSSVGPHSPSVSPHSPSVSPESPVTIPDGPNTKRTTSNGVTNTYFYYIFWSLALATLLKTLG